MMRNKVFAVVVILVLTIGLIPIPSASAYSNSDLIDNQVFDNKDSMNAAQIDSFLNGFGGSCLSTNSGFTTNTPAGYSPSQGYTYGGRVTAGTAIYNAAQAYEINPQVLLTKLQNEEGLVVGNGPYGCGPLAISASVGYGCPDSGGSYSYSYPGSLPTPLYYQNGSPVNSVSNTCVNSGSKAGFAEQIIHAAWLLKFGRMRAEGNTGWAIIKSGWDNTDDLSTCYGGPMTQGSYKRCPSDSAPTYYDGYSTISGQSIHMDTGATAALYWYTPHIQSFSSIYSGWFGDPTSQCASTGNVNGALSGPQLTNFGSRLTYLQQNNTGSTCVEAHMAAPNFQTWSTHIATSMKATDPRYAMFVPSKASIDQQEALNYILYNGAGGHLEIHRMSPNFRKFPGYYDVVTDLTGVTSETGNIVSGNFFGNGNDQMAYVLYSGTGGNAEVHLFNPGMTKAIGYYDLVSDFKNVTKYSGVWVSGDFFGRGYDQLAYITYGAQSSVHVLDIRTGKVVRMYEQETNLHGADWYTGTFVAGDFLGRGYSQLYYVVYNNHNGCCGTAGGNVETHLFNTGLNNAIGFQDLVTNMIGFSPTD